MKKNFKLLREGEVVPFPTKLVKQSGHAPLMKHSDSIRQYFDRRVPKVGKPFGGVPGKNNPAKVISLKQEETVTELTDSIAHRMHAYPVGTSVKYKDKSTEVEKVKYSNDPNHEHHYKVIGNKHYVKHSELTKEETITELNKKTLGSYIKKASKDVPYLHSGIEHGLRSGMDDVTHKYDKKLTKRLKGIDRASDKLAKEETINETLPSNASASDYIHDFVHSKNKMFKGESTKQRIKRALGAFYSHKK